MAISIVTLHFLQKNIARILIPLTTPYFKATSFFGEYLSGIDNRQARPYGVLVRRFADDGSSGGLKGKTAPGDAHPYLAPFYLLGGVYSPSMILK